MNTVEEALKQIEDGRDFDSLAEAMMDLTPQQAAVIPEGCPNSIATIVFHMWFWQDRWLKQIADIHCESFTGDDSDFPVIGPDGWEKTRTDFLAGFARLKQEAQHTSVFEKTTQFGDTVEALLLRSALHAAYHVGQIVLLRRLI